MKNDNLSLWKLKHGRAFLDAFVKCGEKVYRGLKCSKSESIRAFIQLGLFKESSQFIHLSQKHIEINLAFTSKGISIYDQMSKLINRGIIYRDNLGKMNWKNFQLI